MASKTVLGQANQIGDYMRTTKASAEIKRLRMTFGGIFSANYPDLEERIALVG